MTANNIAVETVTMTLQNIEIKFSVRYNKWIADCMEFKDNPRVGLGNTPLEALGDLICNNSDLFQLRIKKHNVSREDTQ
jgi:hypothetical protein